MSQLSQDIFIFHVDTDFFELFPFTHETLFWETLCIRKKVH